MSLSDYSQAVADWRKTLKDNKRKTFYVVVLFFVMYLFVGLLIDWFIYAEIGYYQVPAYYVLKAILTLQLTPYATIMMLIIALIALFITFKLYDKVMLLGTDSVKVTEQSTAMDEKQFYNTVEEMKIAAGMKYMPKLFIISADYLNAFASGYSEKSAMIAVTRGLLKKLNRAELQAVIAHELSHIRHQDIKLTLTTAVLSNIMIMAIDILFWNILFSRGGGNNDKGKGNLILIIIVARYVLPIISMLAMLYLSRTREYMADAGAVELMRDNSPLASALIKIRDDHNEHKGSYAKAYETTAHEELRRESYIFDPTQAGISPMKSIADIFSTHPGIDKRLKAIGFKKKD